jgi:hypothetical protein
VQPTGKKLFQIIPETEGGEDAFAALPFEDEESEEIQVKTTKIKNKNKFKKGKKEVTPEESE